MPFALKIWYENSNETQRLKLSNPLYFEESKDLEDLKRKLMEYPKDEALLAKIKAGCDVDRIFLAIYEQSPQYSDWSDNSLIFVTEFL